MSEFAWDALIPAASAGMLLYGGWQVLQEQLTLGDLMMFLVFLVHLSTIPKVIISITNLHPVCPPLLLSIMFMGFP